MRVYASIFFLLFLSLSAYCQSVPAQVVKDSIFLNDGKILATQIIDTNGGEITVLNPNSRKHKKIEIAKEAIFSIRYGATGREDVYYTYDTLVDNDFTVEEARKFIAGEHDALVGFHAVGVSIGAFAVGFIAGDYEGNFFAAFPPFLYDGIMTYPSIHVRHKSVKNMQIANTDPYLYGYYLIASRKRMLHSFLWSGIGLVTGLATNFIFVNNLQGVIDVFNSLPHFP